jgi:hypothetical protein
VFLVSENSGPAKTVKGATEYSFYQNVTYGVTPYGLLNPSQQTLYEVLKQKVAYGGLDALNKKAMQSIGQVRDKNNSLTYQSSGERINPVIVSSIQDIKDRVGSASLVTTDHGREGNVKLPAGMYRDTGQNRYYLVLDTKQKQSKAPPLIGASPTTSYQLPVVKPEINPNPSPQIDFPKARKQKKPDEDLIFNSPDYKATYEEVIREMSLSLIMAGDDIISNYNYESIDSLPDIDVEIMISGGEYLNAKEVIDKGLGGEILQSLIDGSVSSEESEAANRILLYLESLIGEEATYSQKMRYFGKLSPNNSSFIPGVAREGSSLLIDFNVDLPDSFQIPGANEIRVRFDPI